MCIRDRYLQAGGSSDVFNCGYGQGFSVKEVLDCVSEVSAQKLNIKHVERRAGDPAELIANNEKILAMLDWQPQYNDIKLICQTALDWERSLVKRKTVA